MDQLARYGYMELVKRGGMGGELQGKYDTYMFHMEEDCRGILKSVNQFLCLVWIHYEKNIENIQRNGYTLFTIPLKGSSSLRSMESV